MISLLMREREKKGNLDNVKYFKIKKENSDRIHSKSWVPR